MWRILTIEDYVRILPLKFNEYIEEVTYKQLKEMYEGRIERDVGIYVTVFNIEVDKKGVIIFGDGATYHRVKFKALVYTPLNNEIIEGEIMNTTEYGAFVRVGPINAFIHKTQLMDENIVLYDKQSHSFIGERSRKKVSKGDVVRARIVSVSYVSSGGTDNIRVSMTARQPLLGKMEWIDEKITVTRKKVHTKPSRS